MSAPRKLAAILAADVVGYSRLVGFDEERTLQRLRELRYALIDPATSQHRGRIVKTMGDGFLIEFASAVDAVRCAIDIQRGTKTFNTELSEERRIELRVGINVGDVVARKRGAQVKLTREPNFTELARGGGGLRADLRTLFTRCHHAIMPLLDNLIGARQQRLRDRQAERLRCL